MFWKNKKKLCKTGNAAPVILCLDRPLAAATETSKKKILFLGVIIKEKKTPVFNYKF